MPTEEQQRMQILDWASPAFPLSIREEAAQTWYDFTHNISNENIEAYTHPLNFGTGGLRGVLGNGSGRMNLWTVGRTTVGLCNFLKKKHKKSKSSAHKLSLVIAHDSRRMSPEFAETVAGIAANMGLKVHLFKGVTPTPVLSFAIRRLKASGGVVITASHNPPEYNGYKVYLEDGAQLVGKDQELLENAIEESASYTHIPFASPKDKIYKKNVKTISKELKEAYYQSFAKTPFVTPKSKKKREFLIIYSPLHGTGGPWLPGLLKKYGFQVEMVAKQAQPDGEFPTVEYPNPEEREALRLAEELARQKKAALFLATDPDADRLGAGVRLLDGSYEFLNGNQIGSIMCAWLAEKVHQQASKKSQNKKSPTKVPGHWHILKTIVTTDLQARIAEKNNIPIQEVLTGFKYIAEQMRLMEEGKSPYQKKDRYLFGGEESFGYLPVNFVRDKDALASALLLCEIMSDVGNLSRYLEQVYLKYGLYMEDLRSVTLKGRRGLQKIQTTMENLRAENLLGWQLAGRKVVGVLDYQRKTAQGKASKKSLARLPKSNVIQLLLEPEGKLTIRPSGTEPKIKLYASLRHTDTLHTIEELQTAKKKIIDELALISGHFFAKTGLT